VVNLSQSLLPANTLYEETEFEDWLEVMRPKVLRTEYNFQSRADQPSQSGYTTEARRD
jgi:hypothetical protein